MARFPNQRNLLIVRAEVPEGDSFLHQSNEAGDNARCRLGGGAFKLWDFLCRHSDRFPLWMSKAEAEAHGISEREYKTGFQKLVAAGFIVWSGPKRTDWTFYEYPEEHKKDKTSILKRTNRPFQSGQNVHFKRDETSRESSMNTIIPKDKEVKNNSCRCSSAEPIREPGTNTTTTTTEKESKFLSRFDDPLIMDAYPGLVADYGFQIVEEALEQAWERGSRCHNLRYVRASCKGKQADRDKADEDNRDVIRNSAGRDDWDGFETGKGKLGLLDPETGELIPL